jgi:hypothetical protein
MCGSDGGSCQCLGAASLARHGVPIDGRDDGFRTRPEC